VGVMVTPKSTDEADKTITIADIAITLSRFLDLRA
jgi:hypothetical protein